MITELYIILFNLYIIDNYTISSMMKKKWVLVPKKNAVNTMEKVCIEWGNEKKVYT